MFCCGLRVVSMDGSVTDVPDSAENAAFFGRPSTASRDGAFPQIRWVTAAESGTGALTGAALGPYGTGEQTLALDLLPSFGPGMLVLADRNFLSWSLARAVLATGAHLLWRASASFALRPVKVLPDGTYLAELKPPRASDGPPLTVRVIEYTVHTRPDGGAEESSEVFCLVTSLLDVEEYPALDLACCRDLEKHLRALPYGDPMDPGYRRLRYVRYADDHILGFIGPKAEAEEIKMRLAAFLRETLGLELSQAKTLITRARSQPARFLGYDIIVQYRDTRRTRGQRTVNGKIALRVPPDVVRAQCARYRQRGKPWHRSRLQNLDDYDIVRIYGAEYRGVVNYYLLAQDVWRLSRLQWNALTSMLKTLGAKHGSTVTAMAARHKAKIETSDGLRACFEARKHREGKPDLVARFGGIILRQDRRAVIRDPAPAPALYPRKELIRRLRRRECELCETGATVAVHQVTGLKALGQPGPGQPAWAALMAKMRRKTLIICATCHDWIHANPVAHAV